MTYIANDPKSFVDDMVEGFVAANSETVRRVNGGVVRVEPTPPGQVAVVVGGGSGHYPAFAGWVGKGLAHGAAMGNIFASPSAQQIYSVARAAASDAGILFSYGNYTGDVINFNHAQARLVEEGIPARSVAVTDDIASSPSDCRHLRRGLAGDLPVFKAAAWASEQGRTLEQVQEFARNANERTRTLGVAFSGCTLPGAARPLFTVPTGRMAVGMGIHGEPGMEECDLLAPGELADFLVDRLLDETPAGVSGRCDVAVILNGLGSVKAEELYILYKGIWSRLLHFDLVPVGPEVGEFATSFEMAGVSLTLMWMDGELAASWRSPVYTPAYWRGERRRSSRTVAERSVATRSVPTRAKQNQAIRGSQASRAAANSVVTGLRQVSETMRARAEELGLLDAVAGDGDHGVGMERGADAAAVAAAEAAAMGFGVGRTLEMAARAWADGAGGTSGALWGAGLSAAGKRLGDEAHITALMIVEAARSFAEAVKQVGEAELGDKTMLDALLPFVDRLSESVAGGETLAQAWDSATSVAERAAGETSLLLPRRGRARAHGTASQGTPDPGAISFALVARCLGSALRPSRSAMR